MSRIIKACPKCQSAQIRKRHESPKYKCGKCGATFNHPMKREAKKMGSTWIPPLLQKHIKNSQVIL